MNAQMSFPRLDDDDDDDVWTLKNNKKSCLCISTKMIARRLPIQFLSDVVALYSLIDGH